MLKINVWFFKKCPHPKNLIFHEYLRDRNG